MNDNYLIKLGFTELNTLIWNAKKRIYYSYPSVHSDVATAIVEKLKIEKDFDVRVIIDPAERNFRQGFGEIEALDKIRECGVKVFEVENNMISFIVVDEEGYFIFPQSRIIEEDGKLINAVRLSKIDILKILEYFFPPTTSKEKDDFINLTSDSYQEVEKELKNLVDSIDKLDKKAATKELNIKNLEETRKKLELNKPLEPDLRRLVDVYTTKIQFIELSFTGVKFDIKRIPIPVEALPIKDERLIQILETKIRLFENLHGDNSLWRLKWFNNQVNDIRKEYTNPLKCRNKRVIVIDDKKELKIKVDKLKEKVDFLKNEAENLFNKEIDKAISALKETLIHYLEESKPDVLNGSESIKDFVEYLISQIDFPSANQFKEQINLTCNFYDFTWEDLRNEEVLKELKEIRIIKEEDYNQIVEMRKAFEARK